MYHLGVQKNGEIRVHVTDASPRAVSGQGLLQHTHSHLLTHTHTYTCTHIHSHTDTVTSTHLPFDFVQSHFNENITFKLSLLEQSRGKLLYVTGTADAGGLCLSQSFPPLLRLSHLAAFSTSAQTTHPDADTQTTCVRNAALLGNHYQHFILITRTDSPVGVSHLFYLFNSFDYFPLMTWIYPFLPFEMCRILWWGMHAV